VQIGFLIRPAFRRGISLGFANRICWRLGARDYGRAKLPTPSASRVIERWFSKRLVGVQHRSIVKGVGIGSTERIHW